MGKTAETVVPGAAKAIIDLGRCARCGRLTRAVKGSDIFGTETIGPANLTTFVFVGLVLNGFTAKLCPGQR